MAKLSKDSSPCSLCPVVRYLFGRIHHSGHRVTQRTVIGLINNQNCPSRTHVSNLLVRFFLSLFARLVNVAELHLGATEESMVPTKHARALRNFAQRSRALWKGSV